ncbi:dipeptide ABC transporter ATP-binding protein [Rhodospirillum rubrum]|uniref:dipeptide ABC transporter ATP-binding protein n=1 Tax=Rhodospirillum rubrum TaxID=1085 RepID=UPI001903BF59|nr:dipeptide ABC transporter ATP-binding protein [Rhodospirillum rubrum]MBK1663605.1 dipeptide ABC transporter ATP-binding protein [Rhodospirillum rubrum]MBK1675944.1 dipeptide ABC transporter ATP-binding protein [Rhodospirillum rubrum]
MTPAIPTALSPIPGAEAVTPVLEAQGLTKRYSVARGPFKDDATVHALTDVSFRLAPGRTLAVVGESGCGKSTLARQVTLIEEPSEGTLQIAGKSVAFADEAAVKDARRSVQIVFQDPYGSLNPRWKVRTILDEPLAINTTLGAAERREKVAEMMARVGLRPEFATRYPHMFSGGQRQRIAIARALMLNPRVVVADEPVSALDVSVQAQVLNLLMDLQQDFGVAFLFISHDLSVVRHISNDLMVMYLGRVVEMGPKEAIFSAPAHPYTQALMAATPKLDPGARRNREPLKGELPSPLSPPPGCTFHTRCPLAVALCKQQIPTLRPVGGREVACHRAEDALDSPRV